MSEPTTEAGKVWLAGPWLERERARQNIIAIEQEARANADRELREAAKALVVAYEEFEGSHWHEEEQAYVRLRDALRPASER